MSTRTPGAAPLGAWAAHRAARWSVWVVAAIATGAQAATITLTQVADFSGRGRGIAVPTSEGAKACIAAYNATPAGAALPARFVVQDDGFDPARSRALSEQAVRAGTTAFINTVGADTSRAIAEIADAASVPVVGAITGASSVRSRKHASLFFIRSSIAHEGRHAVRHLVTLNLKRIAVLHTDDAYGRDGLEAVRSAMAEAGLQAPLTASYVTSAKDSGDAAQKLAGAEAIVMFGSGPVLADFVTRIKGLRSGAMLIAASAANMRSLVDSVGLQNARGIGYLRSAPPVSQRTTLGRQFGLIWKQYGLRQEPTPFHLEGCLAAQVALRAAQPSGAALTPARLMRTLQTSVIPPFGDFRLDFRNPANEGSSWVSIAVVNQAGVLLD